MTFPQRLVIASRNPGKIREIRRICADWPVEWLTHEDLEWPDVDETGETYLENALLKARGVAAAAREAALADDSGIEVDALGGAPGARSARYAGEHASDEENLEKLLREVPADGDRRVAYVCAVAYVAPGGEERLFEARCDGELAREPRGEGGFGYDPAFVPVEHPDRTMAELEPREKDAISHRGRAFRALAAELAKLA